MLQPIPGRSNTLGFDAGLGWRVNDQRTITGSAGPRFYRLDDLPGVLTSHGRRA